jgi:CrcB protein
MRVIYFILGAGIGAPLRYLIDKFFRAKYKFPVGILIVNTVGSFVLGITQLNFFVMGFCGAFTTWSAFLLDVDQNLQNRKQVTLNIILTFALSVAAITAGLAVN